MSGSTRTITQIAVTSGTGTLPDVLYALASDGTLWRLSLRLDQAVWNNLPPLPTTDTPTPLAWPGRFVPVGPGTKPP